MRRTRITSTELARSLGDVLGRLRYGRESFVVEKNGKPVALLTPYPDRPRTSWSEFVDAWFSAGPRDPEWADLLEEMDRLDRPPEDPWASR